jgi:hypothetical protein
MILPLNTPIGGAEDVDLVAEIGAFGGPAVANGRVTGSRLLCRSREIERANGLRRVADQVELV